MRLSRSAPCLTDMSPRRQTVAATPSTRNDRVAGRREVLWETGRALLSVPVQTIITKDIEHTMQPPSLTDAIASVQDTPLTPHSKAEMERLVTLVQRKLSEA